jgi:hypothetical protein
MLYFPNARHNHPFAEDKYKFKLKAFAMCRVTSITKCHTQQLHTLLLYINRLLLKCQLCLIIISSNENKV